MPFVLSTKPCRLRLLLPQMRMIVRFPRDANCPIWITGRRGGLPALQRMHPGNGKHHRRFQEQTEHAYAAGGPQAGGNKQIGLSLPTTALGRSEKDIAYLQPFGCLLVLDAKSLNVIAFSENAPEMLSTVCHVVPSIYESPMLSLGTNVLSLFMEYSATSLYMVLRSADVSSPNPVLVECRSSGKLFYAIAHQVTGTDCLMVDFEPVKPSEFSTAAAWALPQSYMLVAPAVSKIQSVPGGSMEVLCHTLVQEIFDLVGYDRVMAYKFHEDYHGEIIAEVRKPGLEPYIGLHYPATDIPQAARILFMKHQVHMMCDCSLRPVKIIKDEELPFNVSLCGSTLGVPHSCHLQYTKNMKSVASLVMAVLISENGEYSEAKHEQPTQWRHPRKKLWGLIVCQHMSPRHVPFSLRHACEFIVQVFAVHINKELELEKQMRHTSMIKRSSHMDFEMGELVLQDMVEAAASEVWPACQGKGITVSTDHAEKFRKQRLSNPYLMQLLQNLLFDFLFASVKFCPVGGSIVISCNQTMEIGENINIMDLELRIKHTMIALPEEMFSQMLEGENEEQSEEDLTLVICRNIMTLTN
ncbi:unnamed protein product [Miscanthus lutarioriparius]|uniref:Phytochrome chromophore attachment site domain-containing protein n=1 Tax=Miscanthus lutarioriparius TaxID=422564 RepID=A0A811QE77_9POAL|nr:unnamed protein product [Miscanthus lutarioriparius]